MELVAVKLHLVRSNDRQVLVIFEYLFHRCQTELKGALTRSVGLPVGRPRVHVFRRVGPEQVAQQPLKWRLDEAIDRVDVTDVAELR